MPSWTYRRLESCLADIGFADKKCKDSFDHKRLNTVAAGFSHILVAMESCMVFIPTRRVHVFQRLFVNMGVCTIVVLHGSI